MPKHAKKPHEHEGPGKGRDPEVLGGVIVQFNFSPRGAVEGMLLREGDRTVQVNAPPDAWPVMAHAIAIGQEMRVAVVPEPESPKHGEAEHSVYRLVSFDPSEEPVAEGPVSVAGSRGTVQLRQARRGERRGPRGWRLHPPEARRDEEAGPARRAAASPPRGRRVSC